MATVLFYSLAHSDIMFKRIEVPRVGERVFLNGKTFEVMGITHFPEGGKGVTAYSDIRDPFVRAEIMIKK